MGRIQIPVSLGGANHLSITLICPPATDNKILLSTLINISPALITRNPRSRKKENKCLARYQTYVTTRIEEFRGKRKKGSAVFRVDLLYEEGSRKRPPTWRRKKFLGMQRYIPPDPFAFESRMRGVFIEGHVSLPTSLALSRWGGSYNRLHRVSFLPATRPAGFRLPFLPLSHRDGYGFDG